jgi:transposase
MKGTCIAIDVSKDKSEVQGFMSLGEAVSPAFEISHDREGFGKIRDLFVRMREKTAIDPEFVLEATGIYHKGLQSWLETEGMSYYIVNPLQSSKCRKQDLRTRKTDKRDCLNLGKMFYTMPLRKTTLQDEKFDSLRQLSRYYEELMDHLRKAKVSFNATLDVVYPGYARLFDKLYSAAAIEVLRKYPHPSLLASKTIRSLSKCLSKHSEHVETWWQGKAEKISAYGKSCVSGCKPTDITVMILMGELDQVENYLKLTEATLTQMIDLAKTIPNFRIIESITGIGENLAARILAEIGDIERFDQSKQLVAYAGIDPIIYQSGKNDGLHLHISKKGNKRLRCLLYLGVKCNLRFSDETDRIKAFYLNKMRQATPMCSKAATIACTNKLIRIIFGMCKTGCLYQKS